MFVGPVRSPFDAPQWYWELDTAAVTGAVWAMLAHNTPQTYGAGGNVSNCAACATLKHPPDVCTVDNTSLLACQPPCSGAADFAAGVRMDDKMRAVLASCRKPATCFLPHIGNLYA